MGNFDVVGGGDTVNVADDGFDFQRAVAPVISKHTGRVGSETAGVFDILFDKFIFKGNALRCGNFDDFRHDVAADFLKQTPIGHFPRQQTSADNGDGVKGNIPQQFFPAVILDIFRQFNRTGSLFEKVVNFSVQIIDCFNFARSCTLSKR